MQKTYLIFILSISYDKDKSGKAPPLSSFFIDRYLPEGRLHPVQRVEAQIGFE
jgi:hypothetical protein